MITGHKLNKAKRDSKKSALLAHIIMSMGKYSMDYAMLSRLTGFNKDGLKYGIQHPENISVERLDAVLVAILDYVEKIRNEDF